MNMLDSVTDKRHHITEDSTILSPIILHVNMKLRECNTQANFETCLEKGKFLYQI